MKCKACDTLLMDKELARVDTRGEHYDLCNQCFTVSALAVHDAFLEPTGDTVEPRDSSEMLEYLGIIT